MKAVPIEWKLYVVLLLRALQSISLSWNQSFDVHWYWIDENNKRVSPDHNNHVKYNASSEVIPMTFVRYWVHCKRVTQTRSCPKKKKT